MVDSESSSFPDLQLSLSQTVASKAPSVSVSVKNTSPDTPVTILKWNSPLDEAALGLGLVSITPAGASEPIHIDAVKLTRKMPPNAESLVTLLPGESQPEKLQSVGAGAGGSLTGDWKTETVEIGQ
ncbi:hypothetical protein K4K49_009801 [Colletotrichum sp. SAR 10_70]|nr:hypothetical protein K4K50_009797 [Colletotrichum sp. SAR 10_71]KAI8154199.1 hypothetical protein K4K49_009801 [Colletotrichum sp. SAR 10_70]KAI8156975.1 hypothetical protein KHU50_009674 [Colletotrichum sp. SAR 10_65]KAI8275354.1 hypothetical protein K4K56_001413 [Colletotrichum sp. SAR 10_98]KAJ4995531.1 hypothetical protein K4K48_010179 [Colletotrichum sp. SAR 10_66]